MGKYKVDVNHRVIWENNNYLDWEKCMLEDFPDEESREEEGIEISYSAYQEDCDNWLDDERANLDIEVDGYIVAFVNLGLWNGRHNGGGIVGTNVKDILHSECDYLDWYCDRYNVRCKATHHDDIAFAKHVKQALADALDHPDAFCSEVRAVNREQETRLNLALSGGHRLVNRIV